MNITKEDIRMTLLNEQSTGNDDNREHFSPDKLLSMIKMLLSSWKTILLIAIVTSAIGIGIAASIPKTFVSTAVVAPELTYRNTSGSLASLANLAGLKTSPLVVTDAMHPDMYPSIVYSTNFIVSLFDLPVRVNTKEGTVDTDLYDYMLNYQKTPWWSKIAGFPFFIKDRIIGLFKTTADDIYDSSDNSADSSLMLSKEQMSVVNAIQGLISIQVEKKTYLLIVSAKMQDRVIAAQLVNAVVKNLQRFVIDYREERNRENVEYYRKMVEDSKAEYLRAQREYAKYVDSHQSVTLNSYKVSVQSLQNEANLRYQMYNTMSQNLLQAEAKLQLETPILVVIQNGLAPLKGSPSKAMYMMAFFIIGLVLGVVWVLLKKMISSKKE